LSEICNLTFLRSINQPLGRASIVVEVSAVQVGPPVLAAGDLLNPENGMIDQDLQQRIERAMQALVAFATASVALRLNQERRS
jgi:hypothetical protein